MSVEDTHSSSSARRCADVPMEHGGSQVEGRDVRRVRVVDGPDAASVAALSQLLGRDALALVVRRVRERSLGWIDADFEEQRRAWARA